MNLVSTLSLVALLSTPALAGDAKDAKPVVVVQDAYANIDFGPNEVVKNLEQFRGKTVTVVLKSGKEFQGQIPEKGQIVRTLHLQKLATKGFYDVIIDLKDISAVEFRAREK